MAASKRRSPKGKRGRQKPSLLLTGAAAVGGLGLQGVGLIGGVVGRNPSITGGTVAFLVIFSFVAANALWYQPGTHPRPLLRTRDALFPSALIGRQQAEEHTGQVTTFKIEREGDNNGDVATTNTVPPATAAGQPANQLVMDIQAELVRRGLYNGAPDGVIGPRTSAAILFFEETVGMPQRGDATPELLAALRTDAIGPSAIPAERPREDVSAEALAEDPVAAAIRSAERSMKTAPTPTPASHASASQTPVSQTPVGQAPVNQTPVGQVPVRQVSVQKISAQKIPAQKVSTQPIPAQQASVARAAATPSTAPSQTLNSVDMVLKIQQGLSNMAYTNVGVDGVVGEQTRVAIRRFQKHYNLPENGEPSEAVLKKLRDIGAL
ncbi:peptidoglycan-binding domain-containing protein [Rhizobium metallidurans]|uniref:Peptidoglycan hydrolase-like protein with peptidoglycan-binding domain n=1 Tax=Rhizobium metallidurans TaxID=1265931 RepID=A0A7W6CW73_9HYPH|nr:peptidoglycan-binding domain-containing protein [Rhizobium metallidurans]MBB3965599.1 peptidoglycan hydrolase-like protein with peptidoglycan-binding domain [Rhizobium metallidurans]